MVSHPTLSLLVLMHASASEPTALIAYLETIPHLRVQVASALPPNLEAYDVVITPASARWTGNRTLEGFVQNGGGWLALVDASPDPLPDILGVAAAPPGPSCELRVLFETADHPLAARLPDAVYLTSRYQVLTPTQDDTETLLYADWHYDHTPVVTTRPVGRGRVVCTTLQAFDDPILQRICYRLLAFIDGRPIQPKNALKVGILGYAPSVGRLHGLGVSSTAGLALAAVCDLNPARCDEAQNDFPDVQCYSTAHALAGSKAIDVVIVATPPNIHADNCIEMMAAGKHVICEKPLALNRRETDALESLADQNQVHLSCHQNRRWDPDYLTIRDSLQQGLIGDLFYLETFVGGYHHPCGYWHSHAPVSGGTAYDWGAHYLDWIVSLIRQPVTAVIGTRHKRVWQDVTNADQERIQIRFEGGIEAEFMHSDIAAARKPKWYLLGTQGAITGQWRDVHTHAIDADHYYFRHDIPSTEMTPDLAIWHRRAEGEIVRIIPAVGERQPFCFHRNLADHLLLGEPIAAPLADSVKVVAILEAASRSMRQGGALEVLHGG
ncbi:MAG: Gfo/Idh/MocA family oxidoreductase [Desulfosarcina sp.]